jgi:hypothetical protein
MEAYVYAPCASALSLTTPASPLYGTAMITVSQGDNLHQPNVLHRVLHFRCTITGILKIRLADSMNTDSNLLQASISHY